MRFDSVPVGSSAFANPKSSTFYRHLALQLRTRRPVDLPHPAHVDLGGNVAMAETVSVAESHRFLTLYKPHVVTPGDAPRCLDLSPHTRIAIVVLSDRLQNAKVAR